MSQLNHPILKQSFAIIDQAVGEHSLTPAEYAIVRRIIHATADFDFLSLTKFSPKAIASGIQALRAGSPIVTDVNMVAQGIKTMVEKTRNNPVISAINYAKFESKCSTWKNEQNQLVIPLIYQNIVFGILVVKLAEKHSLTPSQLEDIEQISQTIAIACLLERRSIWYKQQLIEQKTLLPPNRDAIDNLLHQLRNPITALKTFSKLLIKRLVPEDRNYTIAESILQQTNRLQELLQQFEADLASQATKISPLDVNSTRLETGEKNNFLLPGDENPTEVIDLPQFLAPLLVSYQAIANEKGLTLQTEIPQSLPPVIGNSKALREVISNLIDNALKYTPKPGIIKISTGLKQKIADKNYQGIAIADTGLGIPAQDRGKLFTRYYRGVQAEGNIPGTGLGLAIAKDLLTKMQGKIELISPNYLGQNPGTTFIVWLPEKEN
ncbi:MAG: sensor histidine kinase [Cyanobacteria bacterium J083]|nr:MAG: sensor histidine kinase [Cyanobacteria bacterium J083]